MKRICIDPLCVNVLKWSKTYCGKHRMQIRRHGTTDSQRVFSLNEDELWIKGYENRYSINPSGIVRTHLRKIDIKHTRDDKEGYQIVDLYISKGMSGTFKLHRLVAQAFLPNPHKLPQINHKDGDKFNNHVSNLEWCDQAYNNKHARATGLYNNFGDGHYKRRKYATIQT